MARPTQATLNLDALRHNLGVARAAAPHSKVMAVVKANAYGHGAVTIARALEPLADALAVACTEEALALREAGVRAPLLLLEGVFSADELPLCAAHNFTTMIANAEQLHWLEDAGLSAPLQVWLKVDTGMHRLGVAPDQLAAFHQRLRNSANVSGEIVACTHFASADELDSDQTRRQLALFERATETLPGPRSAANSPGVLAWPASHYEWVRPGYMLYGDSPFGVPQANADQLRPVMTLRSQIIALHEVAAGESVGYGATWIAQRDSRIATITAGYGDGYPRTAGNGTPVLVRGQRAPLAGRVSMDMITVDVSAIDGVSIGDEAILWGEGLPVGEIARHAGSIGYELLTRMPSRPPRRVTEP